MKRGKKMKKLAKKSVSLFILLIFISAMLILPTLAVFADMYAEENINMITKEESGNKELIKSEEEPNIIPNLIFLETWRKEQINEQFYITIKSDIAVFEVTLDIPEEVIVQKQNLNEGMQVSKGMNANEWVFNKEENSTHFDIPVSIGTVGKYSIKTITENLINTEMTIVTEIEVDANLPQKSIKDDILVIEESHVETPNDFLLENSKDEVAEIKTFDELRLAILNPNISHLEIMNNLVRSGTEIGSSIGKLNRSLVINGNGFSISFGVDNGSLHLEELTEGDSATLRIENAQLTKIGDSPILNAESTGLGWNVELENITDSNVNTSRLALIPQGKITFTGGMNIFNRESLTNVFIVGKEIDIRGNSQVEVNNGNAPFFLSHDTINNPKLTVREESNLSISALSGVANTIELRGANPRIEVTDASIINVKSFGGTSTSTDISNNAIVMTGIQPILTIEEYSEMNVLTTNAKRGIILTSDNSIVDITDSLLTIESMTDTSIDVNGSSGRISAHNSEINISTTSGIGINMSGATSNIGLNNSEVKINSSTGGNIRVVGDSAKINTVNTRMLLASMTGLAFYLSGGNNTLNFDQNSEIAVSNTGDGQNLVVEGMNSLVNIQNNSKMTITSGQGVAVNALIAGENPTFRVENNSEFEIFTSGLPNVPTETSNLAFSLLGSNPTIDVLNDSKVSVSIAENAKRGFDLNGVNPKVNIERSQLKLNGAIGQMLRLAGANPFFSITSSTLSLNNTNGTGLYLEGGDAIVVMEDSEIDLDGSNGTRIHINGNNGAFEIKKTIFNSESINGHSIYMEGNNHSLLIDDQSKIDLKTGNARNIWLSGNDSTLEIGGSSIVTTSSGNMDSIYIEGIRPKLKINGEGTVVNSTSSAAANTGHYFATIYLGNKTNDDSVGASFLVTDGATLNSKGNLAPSVGIRSIGGSFIVSDKARLSLSNGNSEADTSGAAATLRFIATNTGQYTFTIDDAEMSIKKTGGTAPAVRIFGGDNHITVQNGGKFWIDNPGNGVAQNGGSGGAGLGNQGIHYFGGSGMNSFTVIGEGSEVEVTASSGPAIDMDILNGSINVVDSGYFEASGRTLTASGGIFNANILNVTFDNPAFMNFRNNRSGGGNIFNVSNGSNLEAFNSDLSLWKNGVDLDGDPQKHWTNIDYKLIGLNFSSIESTNVPEEFNTETFGSAGLSAYSRLSSNNARAIVDELRVPTNADKSIFGHVSVPVGIDGSRSAWTDEVTVEIEIERINGLIESYTAKTVGNDDDNVGLSIYGEDPRPGVFQIVLPDFIQAGDQVRVVGASRGIVRPRPSMEQDIQVIPVKTFPIIPPTPVEMESLIINDRTRSLRGYAENTEVTLSATYNGEFLDISEVIIEPDKSFIVPLEKLNLKENDEIQIFSQDKSGSALDAGVINPPKTNNIVGNINPIDNLEFHDAVFDEASLIKVKELQIIPPVDPLDPNIEVNPENPPALPDKQGLISIDFVSQFNFGEQEISIREKNYGALPQLLMDENGLAIEDGERPNYVQISDRRLKDERNGWQLSITQNEQFKGSDSQELKGAQLIFKNQMLVSAQGGVPPSFVEANVVNLIPGERQILLSAQGEEGMGTWIYRFGDSKSMHESVMMNIPAGTSPKVDHYKSSLSWELNAVPNN